MNVSVRLGFVALGAAALLWACKVDIDIAKGKFSCLNQKDCAAGYACILQGDKVRDLPGFCFKEGTCGAAESCNGVDDTCNGLVDETFPERDSDCSTGRAGVCGPGKVDCVDGGLVCRGNRIPAGEECNGLDDDCNGLVDDTFNFSTNNAHCGACGRACGMGTTCVDAGCVESACGDGLDNDDSGVRDCDEVRCVGVECGAGFNNCGQVVVLADGGIEFPDAGVVLGLDGGALDAGLASACVPKETDCGDAFDNDRDGKADCLDADCAMRSCGDGGICRVSGCGP